MNIILGGLGLPGSVRGDGVRCGGCDQCTACDLCRCELACLAPMVEEALPYHSALSADVGALAGKVPKAIGTAPVEDAPDDAKLLQEAAAALAPQEEALLSKKRRP